ncbi:MAG: hypothetical protein JSR67_09585 [Proteobacteria bacterium]|nr:hypothetical protein [Pseudomonadota bacterium]
MRTSLTQPAATVLLAASLALTGATPFAAAAPAPPTPACANARAELKSIDVTELFLKQKGQLDLRSQAGCLKLDTGLELPAFLLRLPDFEAPYAIRMEAPFGNGTYLLPRIDMLDGEFKTLRTIGAESARRRATEMSLVVFENSSNAAERYLLIYADPGHLAEQDQRTISQSTMVFVGTGFFIAGDDRTTSRHSSTEGKLTVSLVGPQWDQAVRSRGHH